MASERRASARAAARSPSLARAPARRSRQLGRLGRARRRPGTRPPPAGTRAWDRESGPAQAGHPGAERLGQLGVGRLLAKVGRRARTARPGAGGGRRDPGSARRHAEKSFRAAKETPIAVLLGPEAIEEVAAVHPQAVVERVIVERPVVPARRPPRAGGPASRPPSRRRGGRPRPRVARGGTASAASTARSRTE